MSQYEVKITKKAKKDIDRVPAYIVDNLFIWVEAVEKEGLPSVRKISSFHDEPLKGDRAGQRSIRLNRSYRAIYIEEKNGQMTIVEIIEVTNHKY